MTSHAVAGDRWVKPNEADILRLCEVPMAPHEVVEEFCAWRDPNEVEQVDGRIRQLIRKLIDAGRLNVTLDWKLRTR